MDDPRLLPDDRLMATIDRLAQDERDRMPYFLACLGEADRRRLPERQGYSSTFDYCVRRLRLSEDEAYRRIKAARAATTRPELLSALADGQLSLTAVSRIAPHVHRSDAPDIIARAEGKTMRAVEEILAPLSPQAEKRDRVRTMSVTSVPKAPEQTGGETSGPELRVDFHFQGSLKLREAIERAKDLLSHRFPFGGLNDVLLVVVGEFVERHDPQRVLTPRPTAVVKVGPSIPAAARRAVWARDGGRCAFFGPDGTRCQSRRMLEIDHKIPRALGGTNDAANLRLLCRAHNDAERRRILGEGKLSTDWSQDQFVDNLREPEDSS